MIRVKRPVGKDNRQTQGYSVKHKGYDHSAKGDPNYYSSFVGVVTQSKNSETKNWINSGTLTTADYGNYIKIKAVVDGQTIYQLGAHFQTGSVLPVGTQVQAGQVVAQIGNTGNSTGAHSHTEYRDSDNKNFPVEFTDQVEAGDNGTQQPMDKKQQIIDAYLGTRPDTPPSDDEINARLQQNKNPVELVRDILGGDGNAKRYWLDHWGVKPDDINWQVIAEQYKENYNDLKSTLGLPVSADTEEVMGKVRGLLERVTELEKAVEPKVIYRLEGKDYEKVIKFGNLAIILEK
jgi:hypothetical protein